MSSYFFLLNALINLCVLIKNDNSFMFKADDWR